MSSNQLAVVVAVLATLASGCAKVQAKTEPVMPMLAPPPPPPRTVEIYVDEPVETIAPSPAETALNAAPPRTTAARPTTTPPAAPPKPVEPVREAERPATQPATLTLKPAPGGESTTETSIRGLLQNASRDLGRTNYASLNTDGKAQYDTAKRFMQQAEDALRGGNLVFAGKLADKAATMAAVLVR